MSMVKRLVLGCGLLAAAVACALPTAKDLKEARLFVDELMAPDRQAFKAQTKTAAEVGDAACALATKAESEAAKWLLLTEAVTSYARDGRCEQALAALERLRAEVKDIPDSRLCAVLAAAVKEAPAETAEPLKAVGRALEGRLRAAADLKAARDALAQKPKNAAALHRRAGDALTVLDDWEAALKEYARAEEKVAEVAKGERSQSWPPEKLADFWWDEAAKARAAKLAAKEAAYLRHAAALYADVLASGALGGLEQARAERRLAEARKTASARASSPGATEKARYLVIDLSAGPEAKRYPVSFLTAEPRDGWTDEYKTTKLVLRRLEPGSFEMGEKGKSVKVTLTQPFYLGVFEVTQKQWALVMGSNPSEEKGDLRPVEKVSWNMIRGDSGAYDWPTKTTVDANSFMGRLVARTGHAFDLPTEAQWEYACRAGTTSAYNNGGDKEEDLLKLGRFARNQKKRGWKEDDASLARHRVDNAGGHASRHTTVGSYRPNAWGLYDLHGNVSEWCLDWNGDALVGGTDPRGVASGSRRVLRGGSWYFCAINCRAAYRHDCDPSNEYGIIGFRLCCSAGPSR